MLQKKKNEGVKKGCFAFSFRISLSDRPIEYAAPPFSNVNYKGLDHAIVGNCWFCYTSSVL